MALLKVEKAVGPVFPVEVGENVVPGELIQYDASNNDWRLADASGEATYAQAIVVNAKMNNGDGDVVFACKEAYVIDTDASAYSEGPIRLYLSETAGAFTETRPTTGDALKQIVGEIITEPSGTYASGTGHYAHLKIREPWLETHVYPFVHQVTGSGVDRDNDFSGLGLAAANDEVGAAGFCPENSVEIDIAYVNWTGTGTALDTSDTINIDVSSGINDETTSANADGIVGAALTVAANDIAVYDASAAFDAAGIHEPGALLGIVVKKTAEGTAGDDPIMHSVVVVYECV